VPTLPVMMYPSDGRILRRTYDMTRRDAIGRVFCCVSRCVSPRTMCRRCRALGASVDGSTWNGHMAVVMCDESSAWDGLRRQCDLAVGGSALLMRAGGGRTYRDGTRPRGWSQRAVSVI